MAEDGQSKSKSKIKTGPARRGAAKSAKRGEGGGEEEGGGAAKSAGRGEGGGEEEGGGARESVS